MTFVCVGKLLVLRSLILLWREAWCDRHRRSTVSIAEMVRRAAFDFLNFECWWPEAGRSPGMCWSRT